MRSKSLGAQDALLGGGRYDGLIKTLGGADRPGIGYAAGLERLVMAMPVDDDHFRRSDIYVVAVGDEVHFPVQLLARELRHAGFSVNVDFEGRSLRAQMKQANRIGSANVIIVGGDELQRGEVSLKNMTTGEQETIVRDQVVMRLRELYKDYDKT
jgi:histidyl-tRNA synthetase